MTIRRLPDFRNSGVVGRFWSMAPRPGRGACGAMGRAMARLETLRLQCYPRLASIARDERDRNTDAYLGVEAVEILASIARDERDRNTDAYWGVEAVEMLASIARDKRDRNTDAYHGVEAVEIVSKAAFERVLSGEAMAEAAQSIRRSAPVGLTIRRMVLRWETRSPGPCPRGLLPASLAPILAGLGRGGRAFVLVVDIPDVQRWCTAAKLAEATANRDSAVSLTLAFREAVVQSGMPVSDVTIDARDQRQVWLIRHVKDHRHLFCLYENTGPESYPELVASGTAAALSAFVQQPVSARAAVCWQVPPRPHICLVTFSSNKRLRESEMVQACGLMVPTATLCLMDVKDVGRHRPEILCVAKPGEDDCRGARFEEVRLRIQTPASTPLTTHPGLRPVGLEIATRKPSFDLARKVAAAEMRAHHSMPASTESRVPEVRPVPPSRPKTVGSDADIQRQVEISNAQARATRKERRRGASLAQTALLLAPPKDLPQPQESEASAGFATVSKRARRRQQRQESKAQQAQQRKIKCSEKTQENKCSEKTQREDPRHACEQGEFWESGSSTSAGQTESWSWESGSSISESQTKVSARRPCGRSASDAPAIAVSDAHVSCACDLQLKLWEAKLRYAGFVHM